MFVCSYTLKLDVCRSHGLSPGELLSFPPGPGGPTSGAGPPGRPPAPLQRLENNLKRERKRKSCDEVISLQCQIIITHLPGDRSVCLVNPSCVCVSMRVTVLAVYSKSITSALGICPLTPFIGRLVPHMFVHVCASGSEIGGTVISVWCLGLELCYCI